MTICSELLKKIRANDTSLTKVDMSPDALRLGGDSRYKSLRTDAWYNFADAISTNTTISELSLYEHQINDNVAKYLFEKLSINATIKHLNLRMCNLSRQAVIQFAKYLALSSLVTVDLSWNNIEDVSAVSIAESLKINKSLTQLDLSFNKIGNHGVIVLFDSLRVNLTLTKLYLNSNFNIGSAGIGAIAVYLRCKSHLQLLSLDFSDTVTLLDYKLLIASLKHNKSITAFFGRTVKNKLPEEANILLCNMLLHNGFIQEVIFPGQITDLTITMLSKVLENNKILRNLGTIDYININPEVDRIFCNAIRDCCVKSLSLNGTEIIRASEENAYTTEDSMIHHDSVVRFASAFKENKSISRLSIRGFRLLSVDATNDFFNSIFKMQQLRVLVLSSINIFKDALKVITNGLIATKTLESLSINYCIDGSDRSRLKLISDAVAKIDPLSHNIRSLEFAITYTTAPISTENNAKCRDDLKVAVRSINKVREDARSALLLFCLQNNAVYKQKDNEELANKFGFMVKGNNNLFFHFPQKVMTHITQYLGNTQTLVVKSDHCRVT